MSFILFFSILIICFGLLLLNLYLGEDYIFAYCTGLGVLMAFTITFPLEIFGWPILLTEIFYAAFFLATDITTENFSEKKSKRLIHGMLGGLIFAIVISKLIIALGPQELSSALDAFFGPIPIPLLAITLVIMFFEQRYDIYIYSKIKTWTKGKKLWLRNCLSTISTQFLDVLVVYPIFFYPIFKDEVWRLMLAALALKIFIALIDTPMIYLSRFILRKKTTKKR